MHFWVKTEAQLVGVKTGQHHRSSRIDFIVEIIDGGVQPIDEIGRNAVLLPQAENRVNPELASIVGINKEKIINYSFFIGSCLAGVAGILIGLEQSIEPTMGTHLMIKGFTGAVIGGITSVPGAVLGSYLLGFAENIGVWFLPSGYKDAIAFILLFIILLVKPKGLFGIDQGVKDV